MNKKSGVANSPHRLPAYMCMIVTLLGPAAFLGGLWAYLGDSYSIAIILARVVFNCKWFDLIILGILRIVLIVLLGYKPECRAVFANQ